MTTRNEPDLERAIDARVQRRLQIDPRYRNAENAEEQAEAEAAIEREAVAALQPDLAADVADALTPRGLR